MSKKSFDCVQMKDDIQQKLAREYKKMSADEIEARRMSKIISNPLLKKFVVASLATEAPGDKNSTACLCVR